MKGTVLLLSTKLNSMNLPTFDIYDFDHILKSVLNHRTKCFLYNQINQYRKGDIGYAGYKSYGMFLNSPPAGLIA